MSDDFDINLAATMRDIAANSPKTVGKILAKVHKAAQRGEDHIWITLPHDDWDYLYAGRTKTPVPVILEKLRSLGFVLKAFDNGYYGRQPFFSNTTISW